MDITSAAARARLAEDYKVLTLESYDTTQSITSRACQQEMSNAESNVYDVLVELPQMRRFRDRVVEQNMSYIQPRLKNEEFEATVKIPQADIERDNHGRYNTRFTVLGQAAKMRPDKTFGDVLAKSFTQVDYTGTAFFAADKPLIPGVVDAGTFTNLMTEKPSAASWVKAKKIMGNIRTKSNDPLCLGQRRIVICSQSYESTFKQLLNAELILQVGGGVGAAVTNIYQGEAELIVHPWLNAAGREHNWFVLDASTALRAFVDQKETDLKFLAHDNPETHSEVFATHNFFYQVYQRGDVGAILPMLAVGSTGADAAL
jgi:phage major head subunit gpT-like protein